MKSTHSLLAAAIALCATQFAHASAPATHIEASQAQPEQHAAKGKAKAPKKAKKSSTA